MQTLELEVILAIGKIQHRRHRVGIVGRKLRVNPIGHGQQLASTGKVGYVGVYLTRKYRVIGKAEHLCTLDFSIPIGALYQPNHDFSIESLRQGIQPVEYRCSTFAKRLHHDTETIPAA